MDEAHLMAAVCYVNLNPVRARLVSRAEDWPWSSARAHLAGVDDNLVIVRPVLDRISCLADLLLQDRGEAFAALRRSEGSGRPLGTSPSGFHVEIAIARLETTTVAIVQSSSTPSATDACLNS